MKSFKKISLALLFGGLTGFINGFFGGGGGMIAVPILSKIFKLEQKQAHATSIAVILPISVVSSIIYAVNGSIDFLTLAVCAAGVLLGGVLGALALKKAKNKILEYVFCGVMLFAGAKLLFF